jgi:hypothetical protein
MQIGPHSDCAVAMQVLQDLSNGRWSAPGSDVVTEAGSAITFNCGKLGADAHGVPAYLCTSPGDPQDWFKFYFT